MSKNIVKKIYENQNDNNTALTSENNSKLSYGNLKLFIDKISRQLAGNEISNKDDFDFHASSIVKLLGMRKSLNAAQNIISAEIKHILNYSTTR